VLVIENNVKCLQVLKLSIANCQLSMQ